MGTCSSSQAAPGKRLLEPKETKVTLRKELALERKKNAVLEARLAQLESCQGKVSPEALQPCGGNHQRPMLQLPSLLRRHGPSLRSPKASPVAVRNEVRFLEEQGPPAPNKFSEKSIIPRAASSADSAASTPVARFDGPVASSLNGLIASVWPSVSEYAAEMIIRVVEPAIQVALPAPFHGLQFVRDRCTFGDCPPELEKVRARKATRLTGAGPIDNLELRCHIQWEADCSFVVSVAGVSAGISAICLRGLLMIELVGMIPRPPLFKGICVSFLDPPELDLEFQGMGHCMLNTDLIKRRILETVDRKMQSCLVVPNRVGVALEQGVDTVQVTALPPEGILSLTFLSAENLLPMDKAWLGRGTSDPYVKVRCGAHSFRSPTRYATLAPSFNYEISMLISSSSHQTVHIEMFDEDKMQSDDFLGKAVLPVRALIDSGNVMKKRRVELENEHGNPGKNGALFFSAEWRPLRLTPDSEAIDDTIFVNAGVCSAMNLPGDSLPGTTYWVSVSCTGLSDRALDTCCSQCTFSSTASDAKETQRVAFPSPSSVEDMEADRTISNTPSLSAVTSGLARAWAATLGTAISSSHKDATVVAKDNASEAASSTPTTSSHIGLDATVAWQQAFEFVVSDAPYAVMMFELRSQAPGSSTVITIGTHRCRISRLINDTRRDFSHVANIVPLARNSNIQPIQLRLYFQIRFLGPCEKCL